MLFLFIDDDMLTDLENEGEEEGLTEGMYSKDRKEINNFVTFKLMLMYPYKIDCGTDH